MGKITNSMWDILTPEEKKTRQRESANRSARGHRTYLKSLSPEALAEYRENQRWRKEERAIAKAQKEKEKAHKIRVQRELAVLQFMLRTGILYYHHGEAESMRLRVVRAIGKVCEGLVEEYDPYIWNHQGEGNNYMPFCQFGKIWRHEQFPSIYDVPLDGTWIFYGYDSGERGLGAFHRISAHKAGNPPYPPKVDPGGFPPITAG